MQPDLKNKQLPKGWVKDRIGSRVRVNYGKSQSGIRETGGKIPIYGTGGLIEHGKEALCLGDSVLIGRKGTLGNPLYLEHPFWPVDTTYYTSDFDGCTKWFFYLVQTLSLEKLNEATGVPSLSRGTFNRLEVPFPPKPEQEKIAEILTTIDQAIEQKAALITKYQRIKMGLMQDLFTCGIDENGCLRDPSTHKFKPSPLGQIPEEWSVSSVAAQFEITAGFTLGEHRRPQRNRRYYLRVANVQRSFVFLGEVTELEASDQEMESRSLQEDDLLVVEGHADPGQIGRCARVPREAVGFTFQNHLFRLRPICMSPQFAEIWLNSPYVQTYWRVHCGTSSGLNTINRLMLGRVPVVLPSCDEQERIVALMNAEESYLANERKHLHKLYKLKTGLMQDLLTGKVSVEPLLTEEAIAR